MFNKKELDNMNSKISTLASSISNLRAEFSDRNTASRKTTDTLVSKIDSLESALKLCIDNDLTLTNKIDSLDKHFSDKIKQIKEEISIEVATSNASNNAQIENIRKEIYSLQQKIDLNVGTIAKLNEYSVALNKNILDLNTELSILKETINHRSSEIGALKADISSINTSLNKTNEAIKVKDAVTNKDIEFLDANITELKEIIPSIKDIISKDKLELSNNISVIRKDFAVLKSEFELDMDKKIKLAMENINTDVNQKSMDITNSIMKVKEDVLDNSDMQSINVEQRLLNLMDKKLIEFQKDKMDKFLNHLESIFKDITLIDKLVRDGDNGKDFKRIRAELLQPILEERYKIEEKIKGNDIDFSIKTKGDKIREKRKQLYEQSMSMKKNNKDTKEIDAEIKGLDFILEAK